MDEILDLKRRLYLSLAELDEETITENELDIMLLLLKDEGIKSLLNNGGN
jgi:hypothetical protein